MVVRLLFCCRQPRHLLHTITEQTWYPTTLKPLSIRSIALNENISTGPDILQSNYISLKDTTVMSLYRGPDNGKRTFCGRDVTLAVRYLRLTVNTAGFTVSRGA